MKKLNNPLKRSFLTLLVMAASLFSAKAQQQLSFSQAPGSVIEVEGTSSLHDWSMESTKVDLTASFTVEEDEIQDVNSLSFSLPVKSLESGKSKLDNNAYEALKADQHPQITFTMNDARVSATGNGRYQVNGSGTLTIGGVSREVNLEADCRQNGEGLSCSGSRQLNMTDFGIEPPSFMFGAMQTGELVDINYRLQLKQ